MRHMEQMSLPLPEQCLHPYWCDHELEVIDLSGKGNLKSYCDLKGEATWTNCRTWGSCTLGGKA